MNTDISNSTSEFNQDKFNLQLLYNAIYNKYIKEQSLTKKQAIKATEQLISKYQNHLFDFHGLAYVIGENDFTFFCQYFLQDTFMPKPNNIARELAPVHYMVWNEVENLFLHNDGDKLELCLPRGCAKTTTCDFALSIWLHAYAKSNYTLVAGKTEQDATAFIAQSKQAFEENQYIIDAFGELVNQRLFTVNKLEICFTNRTKLQAISSASSMRGKRDNYGNRPSVIIADDYQSKEDVITEDARNKKYNTWIEDCTYAGDKALYRNGKLIKSGTKFIVLGTILHKDCFMSRLLKNRDYKHILKRVVDFDVDEYFHSGLWEEFRKIYFDNKISDPTSFAKQFYYDHESDMKYHTIWDDKFNPLDLAIDYYENPEAFKQEMMNDADKIGEKWFKSNRVESAGEIEQHTFTKTMLCIDPASTAKKNSDSFAFVVGSLSDNGFKYVRKGELIKWDARTETDKYINHVIELLKTYPDITHMYIEKNTFSGLDVNIIETKIKEDKELKDRDIEINNDPQHKNKDNKIATIVSDVNNGRIIFNEEDTDFINEIMDFAGQDFTLHDDAPDITSEFANRINDIHEECKVEILNRKIFYRG